MNALSEHSSLNVFLYLLNGGLNKLATNERERSHTFWFENIWIEWFVLKTSEEQLCFTATPEDLQHLAGIASASILKNAAIARLYEHLKDVYE